jgi:hypothetical protein
MGFGADKWCCFNIVVSAKASTKAAGRLLGDKLVAEMTIMESMDMVVRLQRSWVGCTDLKRAAATRPTFQETSKSSVPGVTSRSQDCKKRMENAVTT